MGSYRWRLRAAGTAFGGGGRGLLISRPGWIGWIAQALVLAMLLTTFALSASSWAKTVHQITGRWAGTVPAQLADGEVVTAEWRVNVNDDAQAPSNEPVDNVTFSVTLQHGTFGAVPEACLTTGVTPVSSLSADKTTLTCNVGTQQQGSATVVQSAVVANGQTGDKVSATGTIDGQTAILPEIPIRNAFGMDMLWNNSSNVFQNGRGYFDLDFEWTLNLRKGSEAGPDSVSYVLKVTPPAGTVQVGPDACAPFSAGWASEHPWSGGSHPPEYTAPFVKSCTLTPTGNANEFKLTLTGIDYSQTQVPTKDTLGKPLPTDRVAVASGSVWFRLLTTQEGGTQLEASAPTYTSVNGQTAQDDPSNNRSSKVIESGGYNQAWQSRPSGSWHDDTYRVSAGSEVVGIVMTKAGAIAMPADTKLGVCDVIDTKYATFEGVSWGSTLLAKLPFEYYTGNSPYLDPSSASYNPDAFDCATGGADPGATGWVTTPPADLSTVKAVRSNFLRSDLGPDVAALWATDMFVKLRIKDTVPPGTDVWTWGQYREGTWFSNPVVLLSTPNARYPSTTGSRDILRVISVTPAISKSSDRVVVRPGEPAGFTLRYSANGGGSVPPSVDGFKIVDTLPVGMTYVAGSASPEPAVTTDGSGRQVLTWTFDKVVTNAEHALTYRAVADGKATPGQALTNSAVASYNGQNSAVATASVTLSSTGVTTIGKSADSPFIPNLKGDGRGSGSWTVTLRSYDPAPQAFTDTIDILPYRGDGRGTSYSGSYRLESVTPVAGAKVYYTTAAPGSLSDDPADPANGRAGDVTGNSAGWTQTFTPDA
ncbi:hypothetical protein, partial [Kitasatospora sp. NPDC018619]|uniref:hypothetical protein n=2 Tax=Kitasatospora TaxID=2063 RepID=UPI0037996A9F